MPDQAIDQGPPIGSTPDMELARLQPQMEMEQSKLAEDTATRDHETTKFSDLASQFNPDAAAGPRISFDEPAPQEHFADIMKQAPLLMGLAAIGGSFGRVHGIGMLQSTDAMMKGLVSGNAQQYKDARADYDTKYQQYLDKQKTWMDVYRAYNVAYKGSVDSQLRAVAAANTAVGIDQKQVKMTTDQVAKMLKLKDQIEQTHGKLNRWNHQNMTDQQNADSRSVSAGASATRAATGQATETRKAGGTVLSDSHADAMKQGALHEIDELLKINNDNAMVSGVGGTIRRGFETVASSTVAPGMKLPATTFQSKMHLLLVKVPEILKQKGKMGKDQREQINAAVDALQTMTSGPQADVKLKSLRDLLTYGDEKTVDGVTYINMGGGKWAKK